MQERKDKAIELLEEAMKANLEALNTEVGLEDHSPEHENAENGNENKKTEETVAQNDIEKVDDRLDESDESDMDK